MYLRDGVLDATRLLGRSPCLLPARAPPGVFGGLKISGNTGGQVSPEKYIETLFVLLALKSCCCFPHKESRIVEIFVIRKLLHVLERDIGFQNEI